MGRRSGKQTLQDNQTDALLLTGEYREVLSPTPFIRLLQKADTSVIDKAKINSKLDLLQEVLYEHCGYTGLVESATIMADIRQEVAKDTPPLMHMDDQGNISVVGGTQTKVVQDEMQRLLDDVIRFYQDCGGLIVTIAPISRLISNSTRVILSKIGGGQ